MVSVGVATVKSTVYSHVAMKCELYKAVFSSVQFSIIYNKCIYVYVIAMYLGIGTVHE